MHTVSGTPERHFKTLEVDTEVYVRNFGQGSYWVKGCVVNQHGPLTWLVKMEDGRVIPRHADHIRICHRMSNDDANISVQSKDEHANMEDPPEAADTLGGKQRVRDRRTTD